MGIDLGSESLKMVQLAEGSGQLELLAASKCLVPDTLRSDPHGLLQWQTDAIRSSLGQKGFKGKKVVTCLPSSKMLVQHMRLPKRDGQDIESVLIQEAQKILPFNTKQAMLRHIVAGEVYDQSQSKLEVILMAASRESLAQHLNLIERSRIEPQSISTEQFALITSLAHLLQRPEVKESATMFVDLGHSWAKVLVSHGSQMVFSRVIRASAAKINASWRGTIQAELQPSVVARLHGGQTAKSVESSSHGPARTLTLEPRPGRVRGHEAEPSESPMRELCEEIRSCVRYHDLLFNLQPVNRVIFLGGQAKNTGLCQNLAQSLQLPALLGDPLARISEQTRWGKHSDLKPGERCSEWAVAFGLSLSGKAMKM